MRGMRSRRAARCLLTAVAVTAAIGAAAAEPLGGPGVGLRVEQPSELLSALEEAPPLRPDARFLVAWPVHLGNGGAPFEDQAEWIRRVAGVGAVAWLEVHLDLSPPLAQSEKILDPRLDALADLLAGTSAEICIQVSWPEGLGSAEAAYLLKRVAVVVSSVAPAASTVTATLADGVALDALYEEGVAAYVDAVAVEARAPAEVAAAAERPAALSPSTPLVVVSPVPDAGSSDVVPLTAAYLARGAATVLFRLDGPPRSGDLASLVVLANELGGDTAFNPYLVPTLNGRGWAFIRGSDIGLRLIAEPAAAPLRVELPDPALSRAVRVDLRTGAAEPLPVEHSREGVAVEIASPETVELLRLDRRSSGGRAGFAGEVTVAAEELLPVDVILRRLQAFEEAQARHLDHWQADNTTHLRFRPTSGGIDTVEVTFAGPLFVDPDVGADWAWTSFAINGVRWPGRRAPQIPLLQPDRATALPLVISFTRDYRYRLAGTAPARGRDCWVVDFEPVDLARGESLYTGRVWIDRETFSRVRSRSVQLGLEGEVVSNQETVDFVPVDDLGRPARWSRDSWVLPLEVTARQLHAVLGATLQVERETELTGVRVNAAGFDAARDRAWESDATMVRETDDGLRYLEPRSDGTRTVADGFDTDHLFLLGGVFWDDSLDFPLPLAGVDWFTLDLAGTGAHGNLFFAGVVADAAVARPDVLGTRWQAGAHLGGLLYPLEENLSRDGEEAEAERIEHAGAQLGLSLSRAVGSFVKLDLGYGLGYDLFEPADDADADFVVPQDTLSHSVSLALSYARGGWIASLEGEAIRRATWDPWGLPETGEYDPAQRQPRTWRAAINRTWWLAGVAKVGLQVEHLDGENLDRFSRWDFGPFGDARIGGYPRGLVTATRADGLHVDAGVGFEEAFQLALGADLVQASDRATGLDRELLAGISAGGTLIGPWETLVRFDVGVPVAGPADGATLQLLLLRRLR